MSSSKASYNYGPEVLLEEQDLADLFSWIDQIPLSRKKKNLTRDFSDGLLIAEIVKYFFPRIVEVHNYVPANSTPQKLNNWSTLNRKVLAKLDCAVPLDVVKKIAECTPGVVEVFLFSLWKKIEQQMLKLKKDFGQDSRPYYHARTSDTASAGESAPSTTQGAGGPSDTAYAVKNPMPLAQLDLSPLDNQTRLMLEEKEQALLASQETVQILQVKIRRLEHLLQLKDLRLEDMERRTSRGESISTLSSVQTTSTRR